MTTFVFANNVSTALAATASSAATTLTLASTANLPTIPAGQAWALTLNDAATGQVYEVVYVTAISGAVLTVQRGQEGTTAQTWAIGDYAFSGPTAGQMAAFPQLSFTQTWTGSNTFSNPVTVGAATTSGHAVNLGQFGATLSGYGIQKLPSGLYIQWFTYVIANNVQNALYAYPTAFPNNCLTIIPGFGSSISVGYNYSVGAQTASGTQFTCTVCAPTVGNTGVWFIAVGY